MALFTLRSLQVSFGGPPVLDDVSLTIQEEDRACITGRNGSGKSTLLKILAGVLDPDHGEIAPKPGLKVAYVSQEVPADREGTAEEVALALLQNQGDVVRSSRVSDPLSEETGHVRVLEFLTRFAVPAQTRFSDLSGGLRRRVFLAAALSCEPDLLLLDEPTNHLDIESIEWLEKYLKRAPFACVFITHDRTFLQRTARRVFDLQQGRLAGWNCDYETFLRRRADLEAEEAVALQRKEKRLQQEESWLIHGVTARRSRNIGRLSALKALRAELENRRQRVGTGKMDFGKIESSGDLVVKIENASFSYSEAAPPLIRDFSALVLRGEKIGLIGKNGSGKTTLLNLLLGKLTPQTGSVRIGTRTQISFLDQLRTTLDPEKSVGENLSDGQELITVNGIRRHIHGYLQDFLFEPDRVRTPVKALSGGERARLLLAKLFLNPGNVLVMDEPTNDLDIETLELLEEQLAAYKGTLLLVSHDRAFLDHVVTSSFVLLGDGRVHLCPGGYETWLAQKDAVLASLTPQEQPAASARTETPREAPKTKLQQKKLGFNEKRELAVLPGEIAALEAEIAGLESALSEGSVFVENPARAKEITARHPAAKAELEQKLERWMQLEELA